MTDMPESPHLLVDQLTEGVTLITLNRPARLNAFTREMVGDFIEMLDGIARDSARRVVILTGSGGGFCSGQDVVAADERNRSQPSGVVQRLYWQEQFAGMGERLRNMPQVVIAAVNGPCAGAGMAVALAADIRIAAQSARFLIASVRLGLTAGESGISYFLPRLVGASRAFEIMLTGRPVDAPEAERIGLCAQLVEDGAAVDAALVIAKTILANSPFSIVHTKRLMWENLDAVSFRAAIELENRSQILASLTDDYKEATAAFSEKRTPKFRGQ